MTSQEKTPWQQYARLLRPEAADLRTIVVYGAASAVLTLGVPLTVDALISNITFGTLLTPLVVLVAVLLGCLLLQGLLGALQAWMAEVVERRIFVRVVGDLAWRLPRVDVRAFDRTHGPELVNRFFDTVTVQKSSSKLFLEVTNIVLTTSVGMTVLAFYHPFLLVFVMALLAAIALLVFVFGAGGVRTAVAESAAKYEVAKWLQELARHTTAFCTQGGADFARRRAERLAGDYIQARRRHFRVLFRQICSALGLQVLASTAVLAIGGWLVIDQQLTPGQLVASELIVTAVVANITKLGSVLESWYDVCAASGKLGHLIDLPLERQTGASPEVIGTGVELELREVLRPAAAELLELARVAPKQLCPIRRLEVRVCVPGAQQQLAVYTHAVARKHNQRPRISPPLDAHPRAGQVGRRRDGGNARILASQDPILADVIDVGKIQRLCALGTDRDGSNGQVDLAGLDGTN